jgi:predicted GNAT family N-acyltransferase
MCIFYKLRESENSIQVAINEEIASYEELDGINIMTDARHGWRKNSKDTSGDDDHK